MSAPDEQHRAADVLHLEGGTGEPGDATTEQLMANAIGGWRGVIDSAALGACSSSSTSSAAASSCRRSGPPSPRALVIAVLRLVRRQSVQQVLSGFIGVAFCAWLASRTGKAEDFYLPGISTTSRTDVGSRSRASSGTRCSATPSARPPATSPAGAGCPSSVGRTRSRPGSSWRVRGPRGVQVPLYLAGSAAVLGTVNLFLGWPLFALAAFLAFRVITRARREAPVPEPEPEPEPASD